MFVLAANVSSFPGDDPFPWWVAVRVDLQFATGLVFAPVKLDYFSQCKFYETFTPLQHHPKIFISVNFGAKKHLKN